ncbi:MAG: hypothetical protein WD709_05255 [Gammaproteobacteria bacterium]
MKSPVPSQLLALLLVLPWAVAGSHAFAESVVNFHDRFTTGNTYLLAQAENERPIQGNESTPPTVNSLFPDRVAQPVAKDKKCMVVCASWGEECTYIDRGPAGTTRSCRRTCQQFTEECF